MVCLALAATLGAAESDSLPLITAAAVRKLTPEQAAKAYPVQLSGTLLLVTRQRDALVLRDDTDGIYVELNNMVGNTRRPGDRLEVSGVTGAGNFAPVVRAKRVAWVGAGPLPPPRPTTIPELNAGGLDAAWVELEGIVRSCRPAPPDPLAASRAVTSVREPRAGPEQVGLENWILTLAQGDDRLTVQVRDRASPAELIDAKVKLSGVVFNVHNANRQFVRASMQVANQGMIAVLAPPPSDPFTLPLQRIDEILCFTPTGFTGHRIRVRGLVTAHHQGRTLWLQDGDRGLRVESDQGGALQPGDLVEVVGFAEHGGYAPHLNDAIFRKVSTGSAPAAHALSSVAEISRYDSNLVQIEARVDEVRSSVEGVLLELNWKGAPVSALLPHRSGTLADDQYQPGAYVRASGICVSGQSDFPRPTGLWVANRMQLLLRTSTDLAVVRPPPWLTTQRALQLTVIVAVGILVILIVVAIIARRQIAQREEARKLAEVEFAAMLAERNRLARELHDTIAQELNAVSMQMELAKNSAKTGTGQDVLPHLITAHSIVRGCLAEARESIWDMRSHILEKTDLLGALQAVAEQLSAGLGCTIRAQSHGRPRRLPPMIENNLLRIGQEAVSNALKHGQASAIDLDLWFEAAQIRLLVVDNGKGFDSTAAQADGHFGLRGMSERVEQMHGKLHIQGSPSGGTTVEIFVNVAE